MKQNKTIKNAARWNDEMFKKHKTLYSGLAGFVERARVEKVISYAGIEPFDTVLELGCEAGYLLLSLPKAKKIVGFDISKVALNEMKKRARQNSKKITSVHGDILKKLPFKKGEFSVIICSETLEHLTDPKRAIANISSICGPQTRLVITVPNEAFKLKMKKILNELRIMSYLLPNIELHKSEWHLQVFSKKMLLSLLKKHFEIVKIGSIYNLHFIIEVREK